MTLIPAACARPITGVGSPQKVRSTGTRSSRHTSTTASGGNGKWGPPNSTPTPKGLAVSERSFWISSRSTGGGLPLNDMMPNPPALLTAAASSGPVMKPIGAARIGSSISNRRQSAVLSMFTPANGPWTLALPMSKLGPAATVLIAVAESVGILRP
jgi:hypothetical protein